MGFTTVGGDGLDGLGDLTDPDLVDLDPDALKIVDPAADRIVAVVDETPPEMVRELFEDWGRQVGEDAHAQNELELDGVSDLGEVEPITLPEDFEPGELDRVDAEMTFSENHSVRIKEVVCSGDLEAISRLVDELSRDASLAGVKFDHVRTLFDGAAVNANAATSQAISVALKRGHKKWVDIWCRMATGEYYSE